MLRASTPAAAVVAALGLAPHPEGGHFRELHRSPLAVAGGRGPRAAFTTIHYLLAAGERSRWHVVDGAEEAWIFLAGGPLALHRYDPASDRTETIRLGSPLDRDTSVAVVPAGHWQAAEPLGAWGLVACTVAPGFEFRDFALCADLADRELVERAFAGPLAGLAYLR